MNAVVGAEHSAILVLSHLPIIPNFGMSHYALAPTTAFIRTSEPVHLLHESECSTEHNGTSKRKPSGFPNGFPNGF